MQVVIIFSKADIKLITEPFPLSQIDTMVNASNIKNLAAFEMKN